IFLGGALRDLVLSLSGSVPLAYASVFALEAVGMLTCVALVIKADVPGFARSAAARAVPAATLAATADM
ncbi:MAG: MFS transporter, partial [Chloroflexales bacterium]